MARLHVRRTWWMAQHHGAEAPLFRQLAQRWRSVDQRERRLAPFALALSSNPAATASRHKPTLSRIALVAEQMKKSVRNWNPWMHVK